MPKILLVFMLNLLILTTSASAEQLKVSSTDSEDVFTLNLEPGQTGNILVYLMSFGDMVEKYLVTLRRGEDNERLGALLSDRHGRVFFRKVMPGEYRVEVSRRIREDGELSTVRIGDIRLSKGLTTR